MPSFKITTKIKSDLKGLTKLKKSLSRQKDAIVEVGHFDGNPHPTGNGMTIADVSLINQQGNSRIPSRPYMLMAVSNPAYLKEHAKSGIRIAKGDSTIKTELRLLGKVLVDEMINVIRAGGPGFAPNSPTTVAAKGHSLPLIDSFALMKDIKSRAVTDPSRKKLKGLNKVAI